MIARCRKYLLLWKANWCYLASEKDLGISLSGLIKTEGQTERTAEGTKDTNQWKGIEWTDQIHFNFCKIN